MSLRNFVRKYIRITFQNITLNFLFEFISVIFCLYEIWTRNTRTLFIVSWFYWIVIIKENPQIHWLCDECMKVPFAFIFCCKSGTFYIPIGQNYTWVKVIDRIAKQGRSMNWWKPSVCLSVCLSVQHPQFTCDVDLDFSCSRSHGILV